MLRRTERPKEEEGFSQAAQPAATPIARPDKTVIGENISIEGDIRGREDLLIQGSVKGSVQLEKHHLTVGPKGQVEAEINADSVTISGQLIGNIKALGKVEITREADFTGEIKAKRISVEDGAYLKAVIELEREPEVKPAVGLKTRGKTSSGRGQTPDLGGRARQR